MTPKQELARAIALRPNLSEQDWKDRRRCRYLSVGMEEQRQRVMGALGPSHVLTHRMRECGKVDDWDNMKLCGVPTCPRCFMNRRARQTGQAIKTTFKGAPNEQLGFLTLLIPELPAHISEVSGIIREAELKLRNCIARVRREDPRWNAVHVVGYWELDRVEVGEIPKVGQNKQRFFRHARIPKGLDPEVTLWLPHFHAIVALGEVSREEFAERLRGYGHGASHQVDLQAFHENRSVEKNLAGVIRYGNKFRIEESYKGRGDAFAADADLGDAEERSWWPDRDIKALTEWLCLEQKGFQSLRFVVGIKKAVEISAVGVDQGSSSSSSSSSSSGSVVVKSDAIGVMGSVRARYNKPLQDTNWPKMRVRRGVSSGYAIDMADHSLFIYGSLAASHERTPSGAARPTALRQPASPQIGSVLRAVLETMRQRAS